MSLISLLCPRAPRSTMIRSASEIAQRSFSKRETHPTRPLSCSHSACFSQNRQLQTVTPYRPHSLAPATPPPRNIGVPDTSIAGGVASEAMMTEDGTLRRPKQEEGPSRISLPEGQAQQSRPIPTTTLSGSSESALKPAATPRFQSRGKLRARKAAMTLTSAATDQLRRLLALPEPRLIRVGVKNRGCSGLAYHLEYIEKPGAFDEQVEQDGVKVLIDSKALFSIIGSEMDWVEDKLSSRFVFRNPNIKEQCGCGESFMV
ncbi:MAG: Iron-sulfur assembly protein 1 [Peltula sp. TS41687]|nr:MAG: Iron-sulfur assembly protein 1 [Peltula sp. TS41687]